MVVVMVVVVQDLWFGRTREETLENTGEGKKNGWMEEREWVVGNRSYIWESHRLNIWGWDGISRGGNALTQLHSVLIDRKTSSFGDHNDIVNELFGGSIYGSMGDRRILNTQVSGKLGIPVDLARMMRRGMRVVGMRMMMMRRVVGRMRRMRVEKKD